jgi:hypothetical protein
MGKGLTISVVKKETKIDLIFKAIENTPILAVYFFENSHLPSLPTITLYSLHAYRKNRVPQIKRGEKQVFPEPMFPQTVLLA